MADVQPISDDERAELVAYLDGEADQRAASQMEAKLNRDPRLRAEAEAMRRAWQLLDFLPKAEPSPQFSHRTMSAAVVCAEPPRGPTRLWLWGTGWAAALVLVAVVGYAAGPMFTRTSPSLSAGDGEEQLLRDLPVIENLRLYQAGQDIYFLNELDRPELFGDDQAGY